MSFSLEDYEPVAVRLGRWWAENPGGRVLTKLLPSPPGEWTVMAELFRTGEEGPYASGLAHERDGEGQVNQGSALENCETSAVGRALANAGYAGTDPARRASREEMGKVAGGFPQIADVLVPRVERHSRVGPKGGERRLATEKQRKLVSYRLSQTRVPVEDLEAQWGPIAKLAMADVDGVLTWIEEQPF